MILIEATIKYKGYDPNELSYGSGKKICCSCDKCRRVRCVEYKSYTNLCKKCSYTLEIRQKMSDNHADYKGKNHPNWKGGLITKTCEICGDEFESEPSANRKFCSKECQGKWKSINNCGKNNPNYKPKIKLICKECGKNFKIVPSRKNSKFCSKKCYDKWQSINRCQENSYNWQGGEITLICQQCGNGYKVKKYYKLISKFCSMKCRGEWDSKNKNGKNSIHWQGGLSFGRYCEKFNNKFKKLIRERYHNKCFLCDKTQKRKLSVHHVNYNKNCLCGSSCEFISLCQGCHVKTNRNRQYWEDLIMCYLHPNRYFMVDL